MANASPSPTPNPDAIKFTLDTTVPETFNITSPDAAVGMPFAEAVFAAGGVAAIFGVNDFVTVRRQPGFEWDPIVAAVIAAAAAHL
jgi:Scaffold protein Nfu/NifU N terminal